MLSFPWICPCPVQFNSGPGWKVLEAKTDNLEHGFILRGGIHAKPNRIKNVSRAGDCHPFFVFLSPSSFFLHHLFHPTTNHSRVTRVIQLIESSSSHLPCRINCAVSRCESVRQGLGRFSESRRTDNLFLSRFSVCLLVKAAQAHTHSYYTHPISPKKKKKKKEKEIMSHEEDLIDYSDEELQTTDGAAAEAAAPAANGGGGGAATKKGDLTVSGNRPDKKGSYVGIHSTGFRDFLLKSELLRAITDCGFEHPSEG